MVGRAAGIDGKGRGVVLPQLQEEHFSTYQDFIHDCS